MAGKDKKTKIAAFDGVEVRVLTRNEHCEPHVHAYHEGDGWELKIFFSYVTDQIGGVQLEAGTLPKRRVVQDCIDAVFDKLDDCRAQFWEATESRDLYCCLKNQYVQITQNGFVVPAAPNVTGAMLVKTAKYLPDERSIEFSIAGQAKKYTGRCP